MNTVLTKNQSNILTIIIAFLELSVIVPFLGTIYNCLALGLIIVIGLAMFPQLLSCKPFKYMMLFFIVAFLYSLIGKGLPYKMLIYYGLNFFAAIIVCYRISVLSKKQINFLLYLLLGLLFFTFTETFFALLTDNTIIRTNAYGGEDLYETHQTGVFSYGFGEALAILLPGMTAFALWTKRRWLKIVSILLIIAGLATQFMASLATSALLSLFFCAVVVFNGFFIRRERGNLILSLLILLTALFLIIPRLDIGESAVFLVKMEDISESYSSGQSVGQVGDRASLYMQSLRVCARNPILGFGEVPSDFGKYTEKTVSMHTSIFDFWGMYGLFTLLLILSWKETIKQSFHLLAKDKRKTYKWAIFSLLFLLLLKGPVTIHTNFFFSTVLLSIIIMADNYNKLDSIR